MDNIAIESFIQHCDEMMIAEESARGIKVLFKSEIEKVKELKKKASEAKGKTKKMLPLYKEAKQILLELEKKVNGMEASTFDKAVSGAATIVSIASGVGAAIGAHHLFQLINGDAKKHVVKSTIAGAATTGIVSSVTSPLRDRKYTKNKVLSDIGEELYKVNTCITVLSNPSKYQKYLKDTSYTENDLLKANTNYEYDMRLPIMEKIRDIIQSKMKSVLKEAKLPTVFKLNKSATSIYLEEDEDAFDEYFRNNDPTDVSVTFEKVVGDCERRFKKELSQLDYEGFECDNPNDFLTATLIEL